MFDPDVGTVDEVEAALNELVQDVVTGMVSRASRDVSGGEVAVIKNDYIGFVGDDILVDEKTAEDALDKLCEKLRAENYDILLILAGAGSNTAAAEKLYDTLSTRYRRSEIIMVNGDQPIYDYILILE